MHPWHDSRRAAHDDGHPTASPARRREVTRCSPTWTSGPRSAVASSSTARACGTVQREFHLHWKTLRKILDHPEPPGYRQQRPRAKPKLGPFLPVLHQILEDDRKAPKKQRHTAKRVFERLRDEHGYQGGLTAVKDAVRAWRQRARRGLRPAGPPARRGPGRLRRGGGHPRRPAHQGGAVRHDPAVLRRHLLSAPSRASAPRRSSRATPAPSSSSAACPRRISYDNLQIAVAKITGGRGREVTDEFQRLRSHYLFEAHFCRVRRPNEKGHVETLVGYARRNFLVPVPAVHGGLEPLNQRLAAPLPRGAGAAACAASRRPRGNCSTRSGRPSSPLPAEAFAAHRVKPAKASSLSLVRFDTNDYSVPTAYAHRARHGRRRRSTTSGSWPTTSTVACHPRRWDRHQVTYDPVHYLALLERKPGALDFAAPLEGWELPVCFGVLRRRLEAELGGPGTRQFIRVLRLLERASPGELTRGGPAALELGVADADAVRLILEHRRERPVGLFCLDGRPAPEAGRRASARPGGLHGPRGGGGADEEASRPRARCC